MDEFEKNKPEKESEKEKINFFIKKANTVMASVGFSLVLLGFTKIGGAATFRFFLAGVAATITVGYLTAAVREINPRSSIFCSCVWAVICTINIGHSLFFITK